MDFDYGTGVWYNQEEIGTKLAESSPVIYFVNQKKLDFFANDKNF